MYDVLVKRLREFASIPEYCENVDTCDNCSKEDICLSFTNKRIIEVATQAADAIEELQKAVYFHKYNSEFWEDKYNSLADEKWIPVTERLPDENGNYLVSIKCPKGQWVEICSFYERDWCSTDEYAEIATKWVTHWMPLPEPPKEE